jgi:5-methylcytosine-specific restriction endonuclease McrA
MVSVLDKPVLMLNKNWKAISTCSTKTAITLMMRGSANGLCTTSYRVYGWDDWLNDTVNPPKTIDFIKGTSINIPAPAVIILTYFDKILFRKVRFTQKALYRRDKFTCGYCGDQFTDEELSIDHIIPRSKKGGQTNWLNCITACEPCNNFKANRTPEEAGMVLLFKPRQPQWGPVVHIKKELRPEIWKQFIEEDAWASSI